MRPILEFLIMLPSAGALAARPETRDRWLLPLTGLAGLSYGIALFLPLARATRLVLFSEDISLIGLIAGLFRADEIMLAVLVTTFTIVVPLAKLGALQILYMRADPHGARFKRLLALLVETARWSMVDVLVLAVVIVSLKAHAFADVFSQSALYFFVAFVVLSTLGTVRLKKAVTRLPAAGR